MSHVKRTWTQENTWVCSSCKETNEGHRLVCKSCGSPREKNEVDITAAADPSKAVVDKQKLAEASLGANWVCEFCKGQVRDDNGDCKNCGAGKTEGPNTHAAKMAVDRPHVTNTYNEHGQLIYDGDPFYARLHASIAANEKLRHSTPTAVLSHRITRGSDIPWIPIGCALAFPALIGLIVWLFIPHKQHARVLSTYWEHTTFVHERTLVHGEGWGSPSDSFNVSCQRKLKGTEDCHPYDCRPHSVRYQSGSHECNCRNSCTSKGNGYSSCSEICSTCADYSSRTEYDTCYHQCDVYAQWCSYDEYQWPVVASPTLSGTDKMCRWPAVVPGPLQRLENAARYDVVFGYGKGKQATFHPSTADDYRIYDVNASWLIKVNIVGMVTPMNIEEGGSW